MDSLRGRWLRSRRFRDGSYGCTSTPASSWPGWSTRCHYPLDYGGPDAYTSEEWLITQRAYLAERSARAAERARRFHRDRPGVVYAHGPELPDDEEFYDAFESGREWTGHWYSRDPVEAWGLSGVPA